MNYCCRILAAMVVMLAAVLCGCSSDTGTGENQDSGTPTATRGEHDGDEGEHDGGPPVGLITSYVSM